MAYGHFASFEFAPEGVLIGRFKRALGMQTRESLSTGMTMPYLKNYAKTADLMGNLLAKRPEGKVQLLDLETV